MTRRIASALACVAAAFGIAACGSGGGEHEAVVIRVASSPITNATVAHWMSLLSPQHVLPLPPHFAACVGQQRRDEPGSSHSDLLAACYREYQSVRQQTLSYLISSNWLIGEAAEQGMGVSAPEVERRLAQKRRSFSSAAEFEESLKAIDHSLADVRLEVEAELAAEKLHRKLAAGEPPITAGQIAAYYGAHAASYHIPEKREFDIGEDFRSAAVARRIMREAQAGKPLPSLQETFPRKPYSDYVGEKRTIYEDIFKATPHVFTGPIRLNNYYFVIDVLRIFPPHVEPLAQVRGAIERKLAAEQHRRTLESFVAAWRGRWTARTDCAPGYVVRKCRQFAGAQTAEEPTAFS